jgi:hypothetical protein
LHEDSLAVYIPFGEKVRDRSGNPVAPIIHGKPRPVIVLRHDIIEGLAGPTPNSAGIFPPILDRNFATVIHEAMHGVVVENDVQFPTSDDLNGTIEELGLSSWDTDPPVDERPDNYMSYLTELEIEEGIISELELVARNLIEIALALDDGQITNSERTRIQNQARTIARTINALRENIGPLIDQILELLGWQDSDGDGLPDFLEDLLEQFGLCDGVNVVPADELTDPGSLLFDIETEQMYLEMGLPTIPLFLDDYRDPDADPSNVVFLVTLDTGVIVPEYDPEPIEPTDVEIDCVKIGTFVPGGGISFD